MNRSLIIILLALIASYATAQTNVSKTTDRLEAATTLNYRDGAEYIKDMIETFRYEGFLEGKRWYTDYYMPKYPSAYKNEKAQEIKSKYVGEYHDKRSEMLDVYSEHDHLFIVRSNVDGPIALTYDMQDTALVLLKCYDMMPELGKSKVKKMKISWWLYSVVKKSMNPFTSRIFSS